MEIRTTLPGGKLVYAEFEGHLVKTDQPKQSGGEGSAPTPFQLFLASIATCAGVYVAAFCQKRGLSTEGLEIIQHDHRDEATGRLARVLLEIRTSAGFPEKYHQALINAATLCAVKKAILDPPEFEITARTA